MAERLSGKAGFPVSDVVTSPSKLGGLAQSFQKTRGKFMSDDRVVRALAEHAYTLQLLIDSLKEKGLIRENPVMRWNDEEFKLFLADFEARYFPG